MDGTVYKTVFCILFYFITKSLVTIFTYFISKHIRVYLCGISIKRGSADSLLGTMLFSNRSNHLDFRQQITISG